MRSLIRKITKFLFFALLAFTLCILSISLLLLHPKIQLYFTQKTVNYLSERLNTKVEINAIHLLPWQHSIIEGLYVADRNSDTLVYAKKVYVTINWKYLFTKTIYLESIELYEFNANIKKELHDTVFNFQFILDELLQKKQTSFSFLPSIKMNTVSFIDPGVNLTDNQTNRTVSIDGERLNITIGNLSKEEIKIKKIDLNSINVIYEKALLPMITTPIRKKNMRQSMDAIPKSSVAMIDISNSSFSYKNADKASLTFNNINSIISKITYYQDTLDAAIQKLNCTIPNYVSIKKFSSNILLCNTGTTIKNLEIATDNSKILANINMSYKKLYDIFDFINKVDFNIHLSNSLIGKEDIYSLWKQYSYMNQDLLLSGNIFGKIKNIKAENINILIKDKLSLKGNIKARGLPIIEETFIDCEIRSLQTSTSKINSIFTDHVIIPPSLLALNKIRFKGRITGFVNDFVAYGDINTSLGLLKSDINKKTYTDNSYYSGSLKTNHFNLGKLANNQDIGKINLQLSLDGTGYSLSTVNINLSGIISELEYKNYLYKNLSVNGNLKEEYFAGKLNINDPNLKLDFNGTIDLSKTENEYNFKAIISTANLKELQLVQQAYSINSEIDIQLIGNHIDDIEGIISAKHISVMADNKRYIFDSILFTADIYGSSKTVTLNSDILDAYFSGDFQFKNLKEEFKVLADNYFNIRTDTLGYSNFSNNSLEFNIQLKNTGFISTLLSPDLYIPGNATIYGYLYNKNQEIEITSEIPYVRYKDIQYVNTFLKIKDIQKHISAKIDLEKIILANGNKLDSNSLNASIHEDSAEISLTLNKISNKYNCNISTLITSNDKNIYAKILPSDITLNSNQWHIDSNNLFTVLNNDIVLENVFFIGENNEHIKITDAKIDSNIQLSSVISQIRIQDFIPLAYKTKYKITGLLSGSTNINISRNNFAFDADMGITDFIYENELIGNLHGNFYKKITDDKIYINTFLNNSNINKDLNVSGYYIAKDTFPNIQAVITAENIPAKFAEEYLGNRITNTDGEVSVNLSLSGSFQHPTLHGTISVNNFSTKIIYLNTIFHVKSSTISISGQQISLGNIPFYDEEGNIGYLKGNIAHEDLRRFQLQLKLNSNNILALNTSKQDNSLYYGRLYIKTLGDLSINGPTNNLKINGSLEGNPNSTFHIPLSDYKEVNSYYDFIQFKNTKTDAYKYVEEAETDNKQQILSLALNLNINDNVEVEIIFDEQTGDIIRGTGTGLLQLSTSNKGDFTLHGDYLISQGSYLFTLKSPVGKVNLVNKRFIIDKGGTIIWNGSPYEANININATYQLRTSPQDLAPGGTQSSSFNSPQRATTYVRMNLSELLFKPNIKFNIEVPGADQITVNRLELIKKDEAELNKQVFALLAMNRFLPISNTTNSNFIANSSSTSVSEFISKQIGLLASRIDKNIDFNFNLYTYDQHYQQNQNSRQQELQLGVSKRFLDNRLVLDVGSNIGLNNADQNTNTNTSNNLSGDFNIEYSLVKDGSIRLKAFRKTQYDILFNENQNRTGLGLFYKNDFDTVKELWANFRRKKNEDETSD